MEQYGTECQLKIQKHSQIKFYILGLNFLQNYYTIFDQENMRIGFSLSIHASNRLLENDKIDPNSFSLNI